MYRAILFAFRGIANKPSNSAFRIPNYLQSADVLTDLFRTNRISDCSSLS